MYMNAIKHTGDKVYEILVTYTCSYDSKLRYTSLYV